jgi:predicted RNase H-like HicB family nuclease
MKNRKIEYPAVFYYEKYQDKENVFVRFPDLKAVGLPAATSGKDLEDAKEAAEEILELMVELAAERGEELPNPSRIDRVNIALWDDVEVVPHKIVIMNVGINKIA